MKVVAVFLSALPALALSGMLSIAPVQAETVDPGTETVPNPFQGSPQGGEPAIAKPAPSRVKVSKASRSEPAASDADAKKRCGSDAVVWANKKSKVYHYASSAHYGRTKNGVYMCEKESIGAGMRAAKNEKHG